MEPSRPNDEKDLLQSLGCSTVKQENLVKEVEDKIEAKIAEASLLKPQPKASNYRKKDKKPLRGKKSSDVDIDNSTASESSEYSDASELAIFSDSDEICHEDNLLTSKDVPSSSTDSTSKPSQSLSSKKPREKAKHSYSSESYHESCSSSSDEYFSEDATSEDDPTGAKKAAQHPDDSNPSVYQKRLDAWSKIRKSHRKCEIKVPEQEAPHPLYPDKELNGALVPGEIAKDLMEYQVTGVSWFLKLFSWKQGGVLADEMGLGKTIQTIAFLASLYYSGKLKKPSLVICPATLTQQWMQEFHAWWPPLRIINLHSSVSRPHFTKSAKAKSYAEQYFDKKGVIFLASYEGIASYGASFTRLNWRCVILDEGHRISNPDTKISRTVKQFMTPYRYILSGTPIQNKLKELWSIYDFVRPGLLGSLEEFDKRIARSIELIGSKGSDSCDRQLAAACARNLRSVIKTYILRRLKSDVAQDLPKKNEQVVYCQLQPRQRQEYIDYLNSKQCQMILDNKLNHMVGISTLRKISNHPDLIYSKHKHLKENYGHYKASGKTRVLDGLLHLWKDQGHRVLIFCQTVQTMEIIQSMSFFEANKLVFMNGSTPVGKRMALVDQFNTDESIFAFLLTTRTGGQGLNLTGADRVVIFDPDWNPTADLQALSRAWRIGQSKEVSIFRLLAAGTIEERVHHLQLYKQLLSDRILKNPHQKLLFRVLNYIPSNPQEPYK
ncbi:DNA repair protein rhp26, variant 3 [Entomophthora muscae]|uniref:DNA repair protein rhp26, variant 3 n=1 Tax=Entomophthora muscae TaxID=34485 RepID=A0ACC2TSL6_9FUNG|nr:DNA repair protein rhp26, variant 3 [Entomophthora muscae]